ncbi:methylated-DNA--[protein]-cysteine S-methyltransferase [Gorillibacterium massiliense]|uniref:methylated-DNA--[protein]-cysteine S-methyltransferase n=1 Tax=Gorillibacterium massiliense TaxID=1280390 RepID=UPI0004B21C06|nr:methylated-DNA--[protein]-cysteine S-methyltransferase [Gorillibacterium massiliense]
MSVLYYEEMQAPHGTLTLYATDKGLCRIGFSCFADAWPGLSSWALRITGAKAEPQHDPARLESYAAQLAEYFAGSRKVFDLPLDLHGTPFQIKVWQELERIPYGETRSYKQIAESIGAPKAVRAVGGANNRNPLPFILPCHRVVGASGALVGYAGGLPLKERLLQLETDILRG